MSELKSQKNDFQVQCSRHQSILMPELLVTSDVLHFRASLCLSQISLGAPFKLDIKEKRKEEEEQLSSVNKK